jgi:hypothetical protein
MPSKCDSAVLLVVPVNSDAVIVQQAGLRLQQSYPQLDRRCARGPFVLGCPVRILGTLHILFPCFAFMRRYNNEVGVVYKQSACKCKDHVS